jgi:hypothetical protein
LPAFSVAGNPFVEFVQASPSIGPWAADRNDSSGYLGYAVDDIDAAGAILQAAGMQLIAISEPSFAFYQGTDGVVFEVVNKSLVPAASGVNAAQASIDLGQPSHLDIYASELTNIQNQFEQAFNLFWVPSVTFPGLPFVFADGSTVPVTATLLPGVGTTSVVELEQISPNAFPFASGPGFSTLRPAYAAQPGTLPAVMAQLEQAGFIRESTLYVFPGFPLPGFTVGEPVIVVHAGLNGQTIETIDARIP